MHALPPINESGPTTRRPDLTFQSEYCNYAVWNEPRAPSTITSESIGDTKYSSDHVIREAQYMHDEAVACFETIYGEGARIFAALGYTGLRLQTATPDGQHLSRVTIAHPTLSALNARLDQLGGAANSLRFRPFGGGSFSPNTLMRYLLKNTIPVSISDALLNAHDKLLHVPAWVLAPQSLINALQERARLNSRLPEESLAEELNLDLADDMDTRMGIDGLLSAKSRQRTFEGMALDAKCSKIKAAQIGDSARPHFVRLDFAARILLDSERTA